MQHKLLLIPLLFIIGCDSDNLSYKELAIVKAKMVKVALEEKEVEDKISVNIGFDHMASEGVYSICGGGYTDKYGITWDSVGWNDDCFWQPRICKACCGIKNSEPPKEVEERVVEYYRTLIKTSDWEYKTCEER